MCSHPRLARKRKPRQGSTVIRGSSDGRECVRIYADSGTRIRVVPLPQRAASAWYHIAEIKSRVARVEVPTSANYSSLTTAATRSPPWPPEAPRTERLQEYHDLQELRGLHIVCPFIRVGEIPGSNQGAPITRTPVAAGGSRVELTKPGSSSMQTKPTPRRAYRPGAIRPVQSPTACRGHRRRAHSTADGSASTVCGNAPEPLDHLRHVAALPAARAGNLSQRQSTTSSARRASRR